MKPTSRTEQKQKQVLARLKIWLLMGNSITQLGALKKFKTTRLAVYIHRLKRQHKMDIETKIVRSGPDQYAVYKLATVEKKSKLLNP